MKAAPNAYTSPFRRRRDVQLESVMCSKAEVERHHDMARAGSLQRCADRCCGDFELMIEPAAPNPRHMEKLSLLRWATEKLFIQSQYCRAICSLLGKCKQQTFVLGP